MTVLFCVKVSVRVMHAWSGWIARSIFVSILAILLWLLLYTLSHWHGLMMLMQFSFSTRGWHHSMCNPTHIGRQMRVVLHVYQSWLLLTVIWAVTDVSFNDLSKRSAWIFIPRLQVWFDWCRSAQSGNDKSSSVLLGFAFLQRFDGCWVLKAEPKK